MGYQYYGLWAKGSVGPSANVTVGLWAKGIVGMWAKAVIVL